MQKAPRIDGDIGEAEWSGAGRIAGLHRLGSGLLCDREASFWVGSDGVKFYFAVKSEMPPDGQLVAKAKRADRADLAVVRDDGVEVWLAPEFAPQPRLVQAILNANGALYEAVHPTGAFRGDWQVASGVHEGWWHFEGAVSLQSLGLLRPLSGATWRVRIARNWKRPWLQAPWAPVVSDFADIESMPIVEWDSNAVVTQMLAARSEKDGMAECRLRVFNPTPRGRKVRVHIAHAPSDSQHTELDEVYDLTARGAKTIQLVQKGLDEAETVFTSAEVSSQDGRAVYFRRDYRWKVKRPEKPWRLVPIEEEGTARFRKGLIFYASFDRGPNADFAAGNPKPKIVVRPGGKLQFAQGVSGGGLLMGKGGASLWYENAKNFPVESGTLSFWIRPAGWSGIDPKASKSHILFLNGWPGKGYFGVQIARQLGLAPYVQFYLIQYPHRPVESVVFREGVVDWQEDTWHWIVLAWHGREIVLYVDGAARGKVVLSKPMGRDMLTSEQFRIGHPGGTERTVIDEVRIWDRALSEAELREARIFCRSVADAQSWASVGFDFAYYPYHGKVRVRVDVSGLASRARVRRAHLALRRKGQPAPLAEWALGPFQKFLAEGVFDTGNLDEGAYELALRFDGAEGLPKGERVAAFTRKKFEWEHNTLGKSDIIMPPFTPLRVEGKSVFSLLREHRMNDLGLWDQVVAKGKPVLAEPMRFEVRAAGKLVTPRARPLAFAKEKGSRVVARAAWRAGPVAAAVTCDYDYDGMMLCTVELAPGGAGSVEGLDLVVPLRADAARLMHACGERTRFNYSGRIPTGEGVVWDSTKVRRFELLTPFAPYIWLGGVARGVCWFADNDRGWVVDPQRPAQEIVRRGDVVELRVHLVQKPARIERTRRLVFGLEATPVKPMPEKPVNWRRWSFVTGRGPALKCTQMGSSHYSGRLSFEPYPYNHDLSIWKKIAEARKTGKIDRAFLDRWLRRLPDSIRNDKNQFEFYGRANLAGMWMASRQPDRLLTYMNARGIAYWMPEFQTFQDEWLVNDFTQRRWPKGLRAGMGYRVEPVESFRDFTLWYVKQQMNIMLDGLYYDNCFLVASKDTVTSAAYRLPDGRMQPAVSLMDLRALIKRTAALYYEAGRVPLVGPHMTNTAYVPVMAFSTVALDWEWKYGMADFQDRFPRGLILAQSTGRQTGCAPLICGHGCRGRNFARVQHARATMNGVLLVHEIKPVWYGPLRPPKGAKPAGKDPFERYRATMEMLYDFGYGGPEVKTYNYWNDDFPLRVSGADLAGIVHSKKGKCIVILTDYGDGGRAKVELATGRLALAPPLKAADGETGETVPSNGKAFTFPIEKHSYRVFIVKGR